MNFSPQTAKQLPSILHIFRQCYIPFLFQFTQTEVTDRESTTLCPTVGEHRA